MIEQWKPVPGYEGRYEVSDMGRVRSLRHRNTFRVKIRKATMFNGYLGLSLHKDGKRRVFKVHRLVLLAFVGPPPAGHEACHGPGGQLDNRLSNLRWGTHSENNLDRVKHGTWSNGSDKGRGRWDKK